MSQLIISVLVEQENLTVFSTNGRECGIRVEGNKTYEVLDVMQYPNITINKTVAQETYETVSKNLKSYNTSTQETETGFVTEITTPNGIITKTAIIDGNNYTTTLSGATPNGISLTKFRTIGYDPQGKLITNKTYS